MLFSGVWIDSRLKGIILNHTLKSYTIIPIESANVLNVIMRFYGGCNYKSPSKRRREQLRKVKDFAQFRRDPILVPIPFLILSPQVDHFMMPCPMPSSHRSRWQKRWGSCTIGGTAWPRRQKKQRRKGTRCLIGYVICWTRGWM